MEIVPDLLAEQLKSSTLKTSGIRTRLSSDGNFGATSGMAECSLQSGNFEVSNGRERKSYRVGGTWSYQISEASLRMVGVQCTVSRQPHSTCSSKGDVVPLRAPQCRMTVNEKIQQLLNSTLMQLKGRSLCHPSGKHGWKIVKLLRPWVYRAAKPASFILVLLIQATLIHI